MATRKPQVSFAFDSQYQSRKEHGGDVRQGKRKLHRPLDPALHQHVVLRSARARGAHSFLHRRNRSRIEQVIYRHARKLGVSVGRFANVGNHLHLLVRFPEAAAFQRFLKTIAGLIARLVTGASRGRPCAVEKGNAKRKFWDGLAYSRAVSWGRELKAVRAYLEKNRLEAVGFRGARLRFRQGGEAVVVVGELPESVNLEGLDKETVALLGRGR